MNSLASWVADDHAALALLIQWKTIKHAVLHMPMLRVWLVGEPMYRNTRGGCCLNTTTIYTAERVLVTSCNADKATKLSKISDGNTVQTPA